MTLALVLQEEISIGTGKAFQPDDRKIIQYEARGHPDYEILIRNTGSGWCILQKRRMPGSKWERLPREYGTAEEAKNAREAAG